MEKLNIGCGRDIKKDYINLDVLKLKGVDVVHDLNKFPYPFKDNEFDEIECKAVLEHVEDVSKTMNEIYRILKKGGIVNIEVPHFTSTNMYNDPTHKNFFSINSFYFFCGKSFYYDFKFKLIKKKLTFGKTFAIWNWLVEPLANLFPSLYEDTPLRAFPAMNIQVTLEK